MGGDPLDRSVAAGQDVTQVCFDYGIVVNFSDGASLRIESDFDLEVAGEVLRVSPGEAGHASVVLSLLHKKVSRFHIDDGGALDVLLSSDCRLKCGEDPDYEAWTLTTGAGALYVSLPGGGVAHWPRAT
ncbi:DUF6188 family protein [Cellulomonas sp. zg-Y138]|nr:DUF6188 family protein [Cellulomonas chengniuliangii]